MPDPSEKRNNVFMQEFLKRGWTILDNKTAMKDNVIFSIGTASPADQIKGYLTRIVKQFTWTLCYWGYPLAAGRLNAGVVYTDANGDIKCAPATIKNVIDAAEFFVSLPPYARLSNRMIEVEKTKDVVGHEVVPGRGAFEDGFLVTVCNPILGLAVGEVYHVVKLVKGDFWLRNFDVDKAKASNRGGAECSVADFQQYVNNRDLRLVVLTDCKKTVADNTYKMSELSRFTLPDWLNNSISSVLIKAEICRLMELGINFTNLLAPNVNESNVLAIAKFVEENGFSEHLYNYRGEITPEKIKELRDVCQGSAHKRLAMNSIDNAQVRYNAAEQFFRDKSIALVNQGVSRSVIGAIFEIFDKFQVEDFAGCTDVWQPELKCYYRLTNNLFFDALSKRGCQGGLGYQCSLTDLSDEELMDLKKLLVHNDFELNGHRLSEYVTMMLHNSDFIGYSKMIGVYVSAFGMHLGRLNNSIGIWGNDKEPKWYAVEVGTHVVHNLDKFNKLRLTEAL